MMNWFKINLRVPVSNFSTNCNRNKTSWDWLYTSPIATY